MAKEKGIFCIINTQYPNHTFYLADKVPLTGKDKGLVFGPVNEVMTESRIKHFFGMELKKIIFEEDDLLLETMVPKALGLNRDFQTVSLIIFLEFRYLCQSRVKVRTGLA